MKVLAGLSAILVLTVISCAARLRADPPECPQRVPGEVLNITFYPNEDDCTKYWECDNGNLYNGTCPDGLIWNPNQDACDWAYNYECPYEEVELAVRPGIPGTIDEFVCPPPSPSGHGNVTFYPNEENCHKFWECDNGELIEGDCGDLVWNPNVNSCDWDYNYPCSAEPPETPQPEPTTQAPELVPGKPEISVLPARPVVPAVPAKPISPVHPAKPIIRVLPAKPNIRVLPAKRPVLRQH